MDTTPKATRRWWKKKRFWLMGLAFVVAVSFLPDVISGYSLWIRRDNEAMPGGLVRTQIGNYKSTEAMGALPIALLRAVQKFPAYTDCVEYNEDGAMLPKWSAMDNKEQLSVCTYLIVDYLGDISTAQKYFLNLGLRSNIFEDNYRETDVVRLSVVCQFDFVGCVLPAIPRFFNSFNRSQYYNISLRYKNQHLIGSEVIINFL